MSKSFILDPILLRQLLDYDPISGLLYWKERGREMFKSDANFRQWNTKYARKKALNALHGAGYRHGKILDQSVLAHRAIAAMMFELSDLHVDHINGDRSDNRLSNLRVVTRSENQKNQRKRCTNTSGENGVYKAGKKWTAEIIVNYQKHRLGTFDKFEDAVKARRAANELYGFYQDHGTDKAA